MFGAGLVLSEHMEHDAATGGPRGDRSYLMTGIPVMGAPGQQVGLVLSEHMEHDTAAWWWPGIILCDTLLHANEWCGAVHVELGRM